MCTSGDTRLPARPPRNRNLRPNLLFPLRVHCTTSPSPARSIPVYAYTLTFCKRRCPGPALLPGTTWDVEEAQGGGTISGSGSSLHHFPFSCSVHSSLCIHSDFPTFCKRRSPGPALLPGATLPQKPAAAPSLTLQVTKSGFHFLMTFPLTSFGPNRRAFIGFLTSALGG